MICVQKRSWFDNISIFVGVGLGGGAKVTLVSDDDGGGGGFEVLAIGGVGFANEDGDGRWGGGGGVVYVVLVFTICGCWMLCILAHSQGPYCCSSLFSVPPLSVQVLQSFSSWIRRPHQ